MSNNDTAPLSTPFQGSTTGQRSSSRVSKSSEAAVTCQALGDGEDSKKPAVESVKDVSNGKTYAKTWRKWCHWILDILPLVLLLSYILLPALAKKSLDGKPSSSRMLTVVGDVVKYGTTVWPLVFAPIAIQAFKILAALAVETMKEGKWRLETVEALLGSIGIPESLQVMLRRRGNVLPGILALFWLLNPLGSQAIQRLITTEYRNLTSTSQIFYIDSTAERVVSNFLNHIYTEEINALYTASIISANQIQTSPMDQWGNVKIPTFENLAQNFAIEDDGWIPVPTFNVSYTSLIGYPINGIPTVGNSTFNITSSYFVAECEQPVYLPVAKEYHWADLGDQDPCANTTVLGANRQVNGTILGTVSFGSLMANPRNITSTSPPRPILFQSNNRPDAIDAVNCTVQYQTMDSRISCNGMNCSVTHMRPSTNALPPSLTPLENCTLAQNIYTSMVEVCGPYALWSGIWPLGSLTEQYIYMGANPLDVAGNTTSTQVDLDILPADMISERLSRILNTFWMASIAPEYIAGGMAQFSPHSLSVHPGNQTQAEVVVQENVFVFNDGWFVALLGSSVFLFLLGLLGVKLKYQIPVPTRFNYVSSVEENEALFHLHVDERGINLMGFIR